MPQSWDMGHIFYFPSERRHAEDFYHTGKNPTASARIEPANSGSTRPSKPSATPLTIKTFLSLFVQCDALTIALGTHYSLKEFGCS
jgi:hypothetical protein